MLWIKAFHIIAMVAWFAGLFYLPRLFVYHAESVDALSHDRFCIMESRLYRAIMMPAAISTTLLGGWLMSYNWSYYISAGWMHAKLMMVGFLWIYHFACGHYVKVFSKRQNIKGSVFYRVFNEVPTILLISVIILVVVKPF